MKSSQEFKLHNVSCMSCVGKIEKTLGQLAGIDEARVNFAERTLLVLGSVDANEVITTLAKIGYQVSCSREEITAEILQKADIAQLLKIIIPAVLGLFIMVYGMSAQAAMITSDAVNLFWLCMTGLRLFIMFYAAHHLYRAAYKAFLQHHATMDTLISVGTLAAWGYSAMVILFPYWMPENARHIYVEASLLIIALVNLGAFLEVKARGRTSLAIQHLIGLQPQTAHVVLKNGKVQEIAINQIKPGDSVRVRPGEKIALDGIVVEGKSHVDESMLTGEASAIPKNIEDEVYAGTINKNGSFTYEVTKATEATLLGQIVTLVRNAQSTKPSIAKLADVVSSYFVLRL
jgi:Cu+-exporting ATPase